MAAPRKRLTSGAKIATLNKHENFLFPETKKQKNLHDKNFTKECG
jgi:hypothetical protein